MVKDKSDTILLKGYPLIKEGRTSAATSPGHLVEIGGSQDIRLQSVAKRNCARNFALEDANQGLEKTVDYAMNTLVRYGAFGQGMEVQAKLAASAAAIVKGDALEAAGNGTVRKFTDGSIIGYALEAVDNSSGLTQVFIEIEVV